MKTITIKRLNTETNKFEEMTVELVERIEGTGANVIIDGVSRWIAEENIL